MDNYKFCQNKSCEFLPCHEGVAEEGFSCLFCFCPLYELDDCGGNYTILEDGTKDCSDCNLPHQREGYDYIIKKLQGDDN